MTDRSAFTIVRGDPGDDEAAAVGLALLAVAERAQQDAPGPSVSRREYRPPGSWRGPRSGARQGGEGV